jgi:histidinol phosphatase-like enzyme (inositol monophosphatase family)
MTEASRMRTFLDFAVDAAWQAGQLTLAHYQTRLSPDRKADGTPVTVADRGAEELLRALIAERFPDHAIAGEEFGSSDRDSPFRWVLDPIDGTQSFVRGVPLYGVLVGLEVDGEMAVGVVHFPALGEMLAAAKGEGCRWNGRPTRVSTASRLSESLVCYTDAASLAKHAPEAWSRLQAGSKLQRGWSDCYGYCLVASGRAEVAIDALMAPWDCAALIPVLREAGGTFTDWTGRTTITGGNGLATNGAVFDEVIAILGARGDAVRP